MNEVLVSAIFIVVVMALVIDIFAYGNIREQFLSKFDREGDGWEQWRGSRENRIAKWPMGSIVLLFVRGLKHLLSR